MEDEWSSDANEAVSIEFVVPGEHGIQTLHRFHPKFTYPIFGFEQRIFGYKDLNITLRFTAHDVRPNLMTSWERRFPAVGKTQALDIDRALRKFTIKSAYEKNQAFDQSVQEDDGASEWVPPGKLIKSYERKGQHFEIWSGPLSDARIKETVQRMQILVSFFIEGGVPLNIVKPAWRLPRWQVYLVYSKSSNPQPNKSAYSFVGYSTTLSCYSFRSRQHVLGPGEGKMSAEEFDSFLFAGVKVENLPIRLLLSQFIILPPYQKSGHGSALYSTIYEQALADPNIWELTVEDPSEEFDVLRDLNDWKTIEPLFEAASITINTAPQQTLKKHSSTRIPVSQLIPTTTLKSLRTTTKIAPRQFSRLVEWYLLSKVPHSHRSAGGTNLIKIKMHKWRNSDPDDRYYYWWRMLLKQRLFKQNREVMSQMDADEKHQELDNACGAVEDEYENLLLVLMLRAAKETTDTNGNGESAGVGETALVSDLKRKRKVIVDEDDDEDEEAGEEPDSKRERTE